MTRKNKKHAFIKSTVQFKTQLKASNLIVIYPCLHYLLTAALLLRNYENMHHVGKLITEN